MKITRRQLLQATAATVLGLGVEGRAGTREGFEGIPQAVVPGEFVVKPYLQLGRNPSSTSLQVLWQTPDDAADWGVEFSPAQNGSWKKAGTPKTRRLAVQGIKPRRLFNT